MDNYLSHLEKGIVLPETSDLVDRVSERVVYLINNISCVLAVIMSFLFGFEYDKIWNKVKIKINDKEILRISVLVVLLLLLPVLLILIVLSMIYRNLCTIIIKRKDKHFVSYLDSIDVLWSLDDNNNIIEVLGFIETNSPAELIYNIREKLNNLAGSASVEKIFYRRYEQFGFHYWHKPETFDISQYVKLSKVFDAGGISNIETVMTKLAENPMPYNGEGLFEILVTDMQITDEAFLNTFPIIFRLHRSVGDGIGIINFLCNILGDESDIEFKPPEGHNLIEENVADLMTQIKKMFLCVVDGLIRKADINSLHGPKLEGKKYFKWIDTNYNLLDMIEEIKKSQSIPFTDILATALSSGLRAYFEQTMLYVPNDAAVIVPLGLRKTHMTFENNFTSSILPLPLTGDLNNVNKSCNKLRRSLDPLTNPYLLKLCNVFPTCFQEQISNSNQATIVFSNIQGPKSLSVCGCAIQSMVYFMPNRGTTGVGVTALSYGGVLRFGIMADSALVSNPKDLLIIFNGMVKKIGILHKDCVST